MHEKRNFVLVIAFVGALLWCLWAWFFEANGLARTLSTIVTLLLAWWLVRALVFEDRLPDQLRDIVGPLYFDADGVCLFPLIRQGQTGPELSIYYQNRFENPASVVLHLRPPDHSFVVVDGARDVHIAFTVGGGDVGVIHQPISVPKDLRGETVNVDMVAVSHFPRSHGTCLRRNEGKPCGSMRVDWAGNAMRIGVQEVDGSRELIEPVTLHLAMPRDIPDTEGRDTTWRQEKLAAE
jgi:hypothetical protein